MHPVRRSGESYTGVGETLTRRSSAWSLGMSAWVEWTALVLLGVFAMNNVPVWLPPLPLVLVALALFCLGVLAWLRGRGSR